MKYEDNLKQLAAKVAEGQKVDSKLPKIKNKEGAQPAPQVNAKVKLFKDLVEDAKLERQKRIDRERKKAAQKKTDEAQ